MSESVDLGQIITERQGRIMIITIDRPSKYNGFTPQMSRALAHAYTEIENDPDLWLGIVRANGKHFTAGLDLPRWVDYMKNGTSPVPDDWIDPFDLRAGKRRSKPMLFAVKGICYTLGVEMMLAADIVVAADDCRFSQLEVKRAILPTGGATVRIAQRAGIGNALMFMMTGDEIDSPTALRWGLVQKVVPLGQEFDEAMAIANRILQMAPLAVREVIRSVRLAHEQGPAAAIAQFHERQSFLADTQDSKEGVAAFREKRTPNFKGV